MNEMNITSAQYNEDMNGNRLNIQVVIDGVSMTVPLEPSNRHYAEILRQVKEGTLTIEDAE